MCARLILISLLCAILFVFALLMVGASVAHTEAFEYVAVLLGPGAWIAYGFLEGSVHDLSPFIIAMTINVLFYSVIFSLALGLLGRRKARKSAKRLQT